MMMMTTTIMMILQCFIGDHWTSQLIISAEHIFHSLEIYTEDRREREREFITSTLSLSSSRIPPLINTRRLVSSVSIFLIRELLMHLFESSLHYNAQSFLRSKVQRRFLKTPADNSYYSASPSWQRLLQKLQEFYRNPHLHAVRWIGRTRKVTVWGEFFPVLSSIWLHYIEYSGLFYSDSNQFR